MDLPDSENSTIIAFEKLKAKIMKYSPTILKSPKKIPNSHVLDAPITGNGDIGIAISGKSHSLRLWVSKNDFWKFEQPYPKGSPCLIGGVDIVIPALKGGKIKITQNMWAGRLEISVRRRKLNMMLNCWADANSNFIFIEVIQQSLGLNHTLFPWVQEGHGSIISEGTYEDIFLLERKFEGENIVMQSAAAMAFSNIVSKEESQRRIVFALSITTNFESQDYRQAALNGLRTLTLEKFGELTRAHEHWWNDFWLQSHIDIQDEYLEQYYYGAQYIMACCSKNPNFPPGLFGNWITTDSPDWAGDYHLNYNYESPFWGQYSSNHISQTIPYLQPLLEIIPWGQKNARELLDCRGIYLEVGIGPKGFCSALHEKPDHERGHQFWGQKSNALYATCNIFMHFYSTYDKGYAEKAYPYLVEVANFWEDYLQLINGEYRIIDDCFIEQSPKLGKTWENMVMDINPLITNGMLRMFLTGISAISKFLQVDAKRRVIWQHILENLAPLPTAVRGGQTRFVGSDFGRGTSKWGNSGGRLILHGTVWPASIIGKYNTPEFYQMLQRDIAMWSKHPWLKDGNSLDTIFPGAARLGFPPEKIIAYLRKRIKKNAYPNLWVVQWGGGIESCSGIIGGVNEMLLQSYEHIIRVFPTWSRQNPAEFSTLRAYGAFLVSSKLSSGEIQYVQILSEKGRVCRVENPWPAESVKIITLLGDEETRKIMKGGEILEFATQENMQILLTKAEQ